VKRPPRREGDAKLRAAEFVAVGERAVVIGVYWVDAHGERGKPFLFQVATVDDGGIVHLHDYGTRHRALAAAKKIAA
jgi:hypothetical protein